MPLFLILWPFETCQIWNKYEGYVQNGSVLLIWIESWMTKEGMDEHQLLNCQTACQIANPRRGIRSKLSATTMLPYFQIPDSVFGLCCLKQSQQQLPWKWRCVRQTKWVTVYCHHSLKNTILSQEIIQTETGWSKQEKPSDLRFT